VKRGLIVEDNDIFRQTLKSILTTEFSSLRIEEAFDEASALSKIDEKPPEFIFMDINLPGTNGIEITKKIKINHPDISIIILTSYDIPDIQIAASEAGAEYFMSKKAASRTEIIQLVRSILQD
jgi:two-component system chemotaxis response regulator CheY